MSKRSIEEYLKLSYPMEVWEDREEGGFSVSFPDLPGCVTCAESLEEAYEAAQAVKLLWLETALAEGLEPPLPDDLERYSGQFKLRLPKSLHRSLAQAARREGVSMNQYCLYLLAAK